MKWLWMGGCVAGSLLGTGCAEECDLSGLMIEAQVIERYDETSSFEYDDLTGDPSPPCDALPAPAMDFALTTGTDVSSHPSHCNVPGVIEDGDPRIEWRPPEQYADFDDGGARNVIAGDGIFARGRMSLPSGCTGELLYVLWRMNIDYTDYDREPVRGELPPWVLVRVFQPVSGCTGGADPQRCTDTWAVQFTDVR